MGLWWCMMMSKMGYWLIWVGMSWVVCFVNWVKVFECMIESLCIGWGLSCWSFMWWSIFLVCVVVWVWLSLFFGWDLLLWWFLNCLIVFRILDMLIGNVIRVMDVGCGLFWWCWRCWWLLLWLFLWLLCWSELVFVICWNSGLWLWVILMRWLLFLC